MKATSLLKKASKIPSANNKRIRHEGQVFLIRSQRLGETILADAEPVGGGQLINLFDRTPLARALRGLVEMGLAS